MTRSLIALVVLVLLALLGVAAYFIWFAPKPAGIEMEFETPTEVAVGQPFEIAVHFSNPNDQIIKNTKLSLVLPEGISFVGKPSDQRAYEQTIGDIGPGSLNRQSFNLIVVNGVQSVKRITARLVYGLASNPSAEFESKKETSISIGQSSIEVSFSAPEKVFAGQNFDVGVNYVNNTDQDLDNVQLKLEYPPTFQYKESSVEPSRGNNYWDLGSLRAGQKGELAINGNLVGREVVEYAFNGTITASYQGQVYTISAQTTKISIATSPLILGIQANNSSDQILNFGGRVRYTINYRNDSNTTLASLSVQANIAGEVLDFSTLRTDGSLDSVSNTITWNTATTPSLVNISPGASGSVYFDLQLKSQFTPVKLTDKNYTVKIDAQIESPTIPAGASGDKTVSMTSLENKVAGRLDLFTKGYFRDASSGILNSGSYPPRVNVPTQYTIHWILRNYATDMGKVRVSANLRPNTKFTGVTKSTIDSKPKYDSETGEVVWEVGNIAAAQGIVGGKLEAIFQVENTPAVNEVDQDSLLVGDSKLTAKDLFTDLDVTASSKAIATNLPDDTSLGTERRVRP
ncbi:MAG TPA: hypothetical protein VJL32_00670 [Candidatus Paceibacterota bacterium]